MSPNQDKFKPRSVYEAFEYAALVMPRNETISRVLRDPQVTDEIAKTIHGLGQRKVINLAHCYEESKIALALYSGDGFVVKVIPTDYMGRTQNVIYHLPSISTHTVAQTNGIDRSFVVKTYPWVKPGNVTESDIEIMRKKIRKIGMEFLPGDDRPKNVHRLPDSRMSLIGIDSDMFTAGPEGVRISDEAVNGWHAFLHHLYPFYDVGYIPAQTRDTEYNFVSNHNPDAIIHQFDERFIYEVDETQTPAVETRSLWDRFLSP